MSFFRSLLSIRARPAASRLGSHVGHMWLKTPHVLSNPPLLFANCQDFYTHSFTNEVLWSSRACLSVRIRKGPDSGLLLRGMSLLSFADVRRRHQIYASFESKISTHVNLFGTFWLFYFLFPLVFKSTPSRFIEIQRQRFLPNTELCLQGFLRKIKI